ncbi:MAG: trimethylamine methyltransferase family protein [Desulfobacterium sp.]|nr:trimethylamine methyltransferase family protein [Desulfobacterium sp.]
MFKRMEGFSENDIDKIHNAVMEVLRDIGVAFHEPEALEIFKNHGFKVEGRTVYFSENQVMKALDTVPSEYTIFARNPENDVKVGGDNFALLPGWGAPFIIDNDGEQRNAVMEDYENFCKLVHTSKYLDMNGFLMVMPSDINPQESHLDMILANILLTDKAFMGSPQDRSKAVDSLEMVSILWGGKDKILNKPVLPSKVNPVSPLIYSEEMVGTLIEYATLGQPLEFPDLILSGTTAPITLAGTATVMMAEDLAGVVLAQLINPGTPCVIGGNTCATDMRTGGMALGGPEAIKIIHIIAQMGRFYGVPTKSGGSLTDAFFPDMQAGVESALSMFTSIAAGSHFMNQSCGILAGFNAMSFEKFLLDEEICGMVRKIVTPVEVTEESIGMDQIKRAGIGGAYITFPETFKKCRTELFMPEHATRGSYETWAVQGKKKVHTKAHESLIKRLDTYKKPDIDPSIEKELREFVAQRRAAISK